MLYNKYREWVTVVDENVKNSHPLFTINEQGDVSS